MRVFATIGLCCILAVAFTASAADLRTWTDASGRHSVEAELISIAGDVVILQKSDGTRITTALDKLSIEDRCWAVEHTVGPQFAEYLRLMETRKQTTVDSVQATIAALKEGQELVRQLAKNPGQQLRRMQEGEREPPWSFPPGLEPSGLPPWPRHLLGGTRERTAAIRNWAKAVSEKIPSIIEEQETQLASQQTATCDTFILPAATQPASWSAPRAIERGSQEDFAARHRWKMMATLRYSSVLKLGLIGRFWPDAAYVVVQVVGPNEFHAQMAHAEFEPVRFAVRGVPCADLAEQQAVSLPGLFQVTTTETYVTALGASKTIFVVEPIQIPGIK